jgi:hypothetical protein
MFPGHYQYMERASKHAYSRRKIGGVCDNVSKMWFDFGQTISVGGSVSAGPKQQ